PAGIDTQRWAPAAAITKKFDVLIYNKIMWNKEENSIHLRQPIIDKLNNMGISYHEITYGQYNENEYYNLLQQCRAMIFLCEHESQGFACCEALSMNVPVFAWDQGYWLDPNRFEWNDPVVPATSIPFFDERCGMSFKDIRQFNDQFYTFWNNTINEKYNPRQYVLENLTLKKSAERMLEIIRSVYK
ncbi:MAG TPA: glycosyltransferase family 1 protein, partial [Mucilaginibacter sp.]